ncbi:MAG: hypothetical protein AB1772_01295 [Candidatus Zixiibacteriota bacterium]
MSLAKETTKCPYCKEPIASGAVRCKHCHADLAARSEKKKSLFAGLDTFRTGFLCGIAFSLVIAVLAYFQFFRGD